jgi:hypothetical protein
MNGCRAWLRTRGARAGANRSFGGVARGLAPTSLAMRLAAAACALALVLAVRAPSPVVAASLCLGPSSQGRNATRDCDQIAPHWEPNEWRGFSETTAERCWEQPLACQDGYGEIWCLYEWSLSASAEDPGVQVAPLPEDGWLYLWGGATGSAVDGLSAVEFGFTGTLVPVEFEAIYPAMFWDASELPDFRITAVGGCPDGPTLFGRIQVRDPSPVEGTTWGRVKGMYR